MDRITDLMPTRTISIYTVRLFIGLWLPSRGNGVSMIEMCLYIDVYREKGEREGERGRVFVSLRWHPSFKFKFLIYQF
jgi:hypothetical protein